ncbi:MAG: T9SS C-terminal target domain-containing protein, partial [Ignavibacteriae bacterium]
YPNPFNPSTQIEFRIPETGNVKLAVYNLVGEEVALLVNGQVEAGVHEVTFNADNLPSGAYFYKLQSGSKVEVKKMLLTK